MADDITGDILAPTKPVSLKSAIATVCVVLLALFLIGDDPIPKARLYPFALGLPFANLVIDKFFTWLQVLNGKKKTRRKLRMYRAYFLALPDVSIDFAEISQLISLCEKHAQISDNGTARLALNNLADSILRLRQESYSRYCQLNKHSSEAVSRQLSSVIEHL